MPFEVVFSQSCEVLEGEDPRAVAETNARAKLRGALLPPGVEEGTFVLATDTVVSLGQRVLGKATCKEEAVAMLAALAGQTHHVVSGIALGRTGPADETGSSCCPDPLVDSAVTEVTFAPLSPTEIEAYVASGEWQGKAGAYAIQGLAALFSSGIKGEYSNVVGLPLHLLAEMFRRLGFDLVRRTWV